jgi:hypothetical protein
MIPKEKIWKGWRIFKKKKSNMGITRCFFLYLENMNLAKRMDSRI